GIRVGRVVVERALHRRDAGLLVLHPADRGARPAPRGRAARARARRPTNVARGHRQRGRREQARNERRAVHDVLAFPAAGLAGTVLAAVVDMSVRIAGPGPAETAPGG